MLVKVIRVMRSQKKVIVNTLNFVEGVPVGTRIELPLFMMPKGSDTLTTDKVELNLSAIDLQDKK